MESNEFNHEENKVDEFAKMNGENKVDEFEQIGKREAPPAPPVIPAPPAMPAPPAPPFYAKPHREHRSIFWPIILITLGALFLLSNLGITSGFNFGMLVPYWPVLLILIGVDLLFSRISTFLSGLLGLAVAGGMIWLFVAGPGATTGTEWPVNFPAIFTTTDQEAITEEFAAPLEAADEATVDITTSVGPVTISALEDPEMLFDATITHLGVLDFNDSGERSRRITLGPRPTINTNWNGFNNNELNWDIAINPEVPLDLLVGASVGDLTLDLGEMALRHLEVNMSVGSAEITLPAGTYTMDYESSVGDGHIIIPSGSDGEYTLNMSTGTVSFDIADRANATILIEDSSVGDLKIRASDKVGVRLVVRDSGVGDIRVPAGMVKVSELDNDDTGTWETENYDSADYQIEIIVDNISTGDVIIELN